VEALIRLYPDQFKKVEVYEIRQADIPQSSAIPDIPGAREQVLIQLFHRPTLLNQQAGGKWAYFRVNQSGMY
jgi:hypothetical protein